MSAVLEQNTSTSSWAYGYLGTLMATTFPVPAWASKVDYVNLFIFRTGTISGNVTAYLYATSGGVPTGGAIASGTVACSSVTTSSSGGWYTFNFSDVSVTPGATYAVAMGHPGSDASHVINWRRNTDDAYGGTTWTGFYKLSGGAWTKYSEERDYGFQVYGYGVPTGMGSTTTSSVTNTSMGVSSTVTGDGSATITSKGFCYSSSTATPTLANSYTVVGSGTGAFSTTISGLSAGTTYYIRSFATNAAGTSYGAVATQATTYSAPAVTTSAVSSVDKFTATFNGNVTADNGSTVTERGFVYSTTANPLIGGAGVIKQTVVGTTGVYSYGASSLSAKTTYYVKAYATNAAGTGYGSQTSFETLSAAPSVTSTGVTNLLDTTATLSGNVTSDNGSAITERGVVYGISSNPTTANTKITSSGTTGTYDCNATGFTPATTYYYRAFATNAYGTSYGADTAFKTEPSEPTLLAGTVAGKTQINLTWTKGTGSTYTIIRRATGAYPTGPGDGTDVYSGVGTSTSDTGLSAGTTYYYRAWAREGSANYSTDTADLTKTTDYGLTNPTEVYAEDSTYATAPANDNKVYIRLSKDAGVTWGTEIEGTLGATNATITFGSSTEVIWGETWTGDDVDDTSFRLLITLGSNKTSYQILKNFGFTISNTYTLTGLVVNVKGYFDADTSYIDGVSVKCYYGTSVLPVKAGAQAFDSTLGRVTYYDGTNWTPLVTQDDIPSSVLAGTVTMYAGSSAPAGYLMCDGSAVSRSTYSDLFTVIGEAYGVGDGTTTFNLPNLKGKIPVGYDSGDTAFDALGETGGAKDVTLTAAQSGVPAHGHTQASHDHGSISSSGSHTHSGTTDGGGAHDHDIYYKYFTDLTGIDTVGGWALLRRNESGDSVYGTDTDAAHAVANHTHGFSVSSSGAHTHTISSATPTINNNTAANASSSHTNLQPYIVMNYIIKY